MHEFFLVSTIANDDLLKARSLLQGYCAMAEHHRYHRLLHIISPEPSALKKLPDIEKSPNGKQFAELHSYLSRQAYVLLVKVQVNEGELGIP
jgi:mediator of RNA polymerase II transcription subunit 18